MTRSPKGLIENRSVTPEEMAELGMLGCPDVRQEIKKLFAYWRSVAESYIEANPAPDGTLDRTAAAKEVLHSLAAAERNAAIGDLHRAVYYTQLSSIYTNQLAIVDNEPAIVARQASIEGARRGGKRRSDLIRTRNREMALEFLSRRGGNLRDSALKMQIGAARRLKRRAAINAVERGLRDLLRQQVTSQDHVNPTGPERELSPSLDCQGPQARGQKPGEIPGGCLNSETRGPRTV